MSHLSRASETETSDAEPLAKLANLVWTRGYDGHIPKGLCKALGYNNGEGDCDCKRVVIIHQDEDDVFDVVQLDSSRINVIISPKTLHRVVNGVTKNEGYIYLTSPNGNLRLAIYATRDIQPHTIPIEDAAADFNKRKAYWLEMEPEIERTLPLSEASPKP
jgi:hypothetical protein